MIWGFSIPNSGPAQGRAARSRGRALRRPRAPARPPSLALTGAGGDGEGPSMGELRVNPPGPGCPADRSPTSPLHLGRREAGRDFNGQG